MPVLQCEEKMLLRKPHCAPEGLVLDIDDTVVSKENPNETKGRAVVMGLSWRRFGQMTGLCDEESL